MFFSKVPIGRLFQSLQAPKNVLIRRIHCRAVCRLRLRQIDKQQIDYDEELLTKTSLHFPIQDS